MFFDNKSLVGQILGPKCNTVLNIIFQNLATKNLTNCSRKSLSNKEYEVKYLRLLHDNAPAQNARIVARYLQVKRATVL